MALFRICLLILAVTVLSGCVMDHRTTLEKPDFLGTTADPKRTLAQMYTDLNMGKTLSQMASLGFPIKKCLDNTEASVKCDPGVAALKKVFSEHVFGNLFGGVNSFRSIDDVVQDVTGNIDSFLLVTIRYKELNVKTLTMFYFVYTRTRKETKGFNMEDRYLFRNGILIYKDHGDSTKGPINETERDRKWGVDPNFLVDSVKMIK